MAREYLCLADFSFCGERGVLSAFNKFPLSKLVDVSYNRDTSTKLRELCKLNGLRYTREMFDDQRDLFNYVTRGNVRILIICDIGSEELIDFFKLLKSKNQDTCLLLID